MEIETESRLVRLCIEAACESRESVEKWRKQRRTLNSMPSPLADALLRRLFLRRLLFPSLLEVFKRSVEVVDLKGENNVDAEWMAYLGAFRYLRSLNLADCHRINNSALWSLVGMTSLKEVDISRCAKVTDAGIRHLVSISTLQILRISETGVTADGIKLLSSLTTLFVLDLGDLPVTDTALSSLQALTKLEYLDLWGSNISNKGATVLQKFPKLKFLGLAWTNVTILPNLSSLECLNLSNCTINSVLQGFIHQDGAGPNLISSLTALHSLKGLESLNLECANIKDAAVDPLSNFQELRLLSLKSPSLTDISLYHLSSLPKIRNLGIRDAVLTDSGLFSFRPPATLEMLDLRGCWLLTEDAILSFRKRHPLIELRHEHVVSTSDQTARHRLTPPRTFLRPPQVNQKQEKLIVSQYFIDQRLKYTREELLALQFQSSSLGSPFDKSHAKPQMQSD
eukprot:XP_024453983.1 uncharacterized protein LOC7472709 isoform X2 [Populus trichocarpa]